MSKLDQYQIQIPLTGNQVAIVGRWLETYCEKATHIWADASIDDGSLFIHPADFPNLLAHANINAENELEYYRIRKLGISMIEAALKNRKSTIARELRQMVVATLECLRPVHPETTSADSLDFIEIP